MTTNNAVAHNNLGAALAEQGRLHEAIAHYTEALRIKPDSAETHNNLGVLLANLGKLDEAIVRYKEALRLNPGFALARRNLAEALVRQGKINEAAEHLTPSRPGVQPAPTERGRGEDSP